MDTELKHLKEYYDNYEPRYGTWELDFDPLQFLDEAHSIYNSPDAKRSGLKNHNRFNNVGKDNKRWLSKYWNEQLGLDFDWTWEYFHSGEPASLHTDYQSFANSWNSSEHITHDCHIVLGIIIPLEWKCIKPYTVMYDKMNDEGKLIYKKGNMRFVDTNEELDYRTEWKYESNVSRYNPPGTLYHKIYADMKLHSVYEWKVGNCVLFDTRRWHSSSWFLTTDDIPDESTEYKRSIIGFASVDIER